MYKTKARSDRYDRRDYLALMNSGIPKTLADGEMMNFDSAEDAGIFFARELDYIKAKTYDRQYPELTALRYIPRTNEVNEGEARTAGACIYYPLSALIAVGI